MKARIHIKLADRGWILEKCAAELTKHSTNITASMQENRDAAVQYYMNYSAYRERVSPIEIGFFTHSEHEVGARKRYFDVAQKMDSCICMADRYSAELKTNGIESIATIQPGVDLNAFRPLVRIGVIGRTYHTGRKGEALVAEMMDVQGIEWRFTGSGWPGAATHVSDAQMPDFYNDLDYVLVPSLYEGGPMSVLEGLACGIPIISSDVGWVNKFSHIPFENGNADSLRGVLEGLVAQRMALRKEVEACTWDAWADQHLLLFDRLLSDKNIGESPWHQNRLRRKSPSKFIIVSHGPERTTRGGPTSRIANIVAAAAQNGIEIDVLSTLSDGDACNRNGVVHVFNSWPLSGAVAELAHAKRNGMRTVFSPIALDLSHHKYYSAAMSQLLDQAADETQLEEGVEAIRILTQPFSPTDNNRPFPLEGITGHFAALRACAALSDHVIHLSEFERRFLHSIGAKAASESLIPNGVDAEVMAAGSSEDFTSIYGIRDFVLVVGRIETRKNQALVAYALRELDIPIVCIGHIGDAQYFNNLKRWAGPNFIHIDRIEDRKILAGAYKAASCFVLTSWAEGAPLAALEAAAAGTPLLLSCMASEREYFGAHAQYFHPCDLSGLHHAVSKLISCPETETQRLARSKFAIENFDILSHTEATVSTYKTVQGMPSQIPARTMTPTLENSHLAHMNARRGELTGVPRVELNVSRALLELAPETRSIVWNGTDRCHHTVSFADIMDPVHAAVSVSPSDDKSQLDSYIQLEDVSVTVPPVRPALSWKRTGVSMVKQTLGALPYPASRMASAAIRAVKPDFEPVVEPSHRVFVSQSERRVAIRPTFRTKRFSDTDLQYGDRLILMGQPWISNGPMLEDLVDLVRSKHLKLWVHIPDILYVTDSESFNDKMRDTARDRLRKVLSIAETAVVISDTAQTDVLRFAKQNNIEIKTKRIILGVDQHLLEVDPVHPSAVFPKRFALYVSSVNNRKRHSFLRDLWHDVRENHGRARQQDAALLFVGGAQSDYEHFESAEFKAELAARNIFYLSSVTSAELAWLYRHCLFTIYPPRSEGWGLPPLESLCFGKPCIVSNTVPSAMETNSGGLIKLPPNDYFAWYDAIATLLTDEKLLAKLGDQAKKYVPPEWQEAASVLLSELTN